MVLSCDGGGRGGVGGTGGGGGGDDGGGGDIGSMSISAGEIGH